MALGALFDIVGGLVSAQGALERGRAEKDMADTEALQLEDRGREEFAAAQQEGFAKRREGMLANSRAQALAAASGGGADDATVVKLMTGIAQESEFNSQASFYGGTQRKRGLFDAASNRRKGGQASLLGSQYEAAGAIFGGIGSAVGKMTGGGGKSGGSSFRSSYNTRVFG